MFFTLFVTTGDVEPVAAALVGGAPWSFVVRRAPLDWNRVVSYCKQLVHGSTIAYCTGIRHTAKHREPVSPSVGALLHSTVDRLAHTLHVPSAATKAMHVRLERDKDAYPSSGRPTKVAGGWFPGIFDRFLGLLGSSSRAK